VGRTARSTWTRNTSIAGGSARIELNACIHAVYDGRNRRVAYELCRRGLLDPVRFVDDGLLNVDCRKRYPAGGTMLSIWSFLCAAGLSRL
jgi:hypothetical protein